MHWAYHHAEKLRKRGGHQVICAGITPSGNTHVGHLREILSAEMIHRACLEGQLSSKFIIIIDSMDPLHKLYNFLGPGYEKWVGHPLAYIPPPDKEAIEEDPNALLEPDPTWTSERADEGGPRSSYAGYFTEEIKDILHNVGATTSWHSPFSENDHECRHPSPPRESTFHFLMNHESYAHAEYAIPRQNEDGVREPYSGFIDTVISKKDEIRKIIEEISGRGLDEDWFPYNPRDSKGSMDGVKVTGYESPYVHWVDSHGVEGRSDIRKAEGKLPWRIDWAARWILHGVTCEPSGKDHSAAGGSFDTGIPICELLGGNPPEKLAYEWIQIKGVGPMSSSTGVGIKPGEVLEIIPAYIIRYLIARSKMNRHIDFDTGEELLRIAEEYERAVLEPIQRAEYTKRQRIAKETQEGAIKLSQFNYGEVPPAAIWQMETPEVVSFAYLSRVAQSLKEEEDVWAQLRKSGHLEGEPSGLLVIRLGKIRAWLDGPHFPDSLRLPEVPDMDAPDAASGLKLSDAQKEFLVCLVENLERCEWTEDGIMDSIKESSVATGLEIGEAFRTLNNKLYSRESGPNVSRFLLSIDREAAVAVLSFTEG